MRHRVQLAGSILLGSALVAAAMTGPANASVPRAVAAKHAGIATVKTSLGRVVSSASGHVMFRFMKDSKDTSTCSKSCRGVWPPVTSKKTAKAGAHVAAQHLGLTKAGQVTYYHHPLYYYVGDPKPGKTKGDGISEFGAKWFVVSPKGHPVKPGHTGPTGGYTPVVPATAPTIDARVEGATTTDPVLSNADGIALYALASETSTSFVCTDSSGCIPGFTPVLTDAANDAAVAGATVTQAMLGTATRTFGTTTVYQVTYNGHPLYTYQGDSAANQDNGQWKNTAGHFWGTVFPSGTINLALTP